MEKNLTEGDIGKPLLIFSLPLILGNLLQQLYNIVDTIIVGKVLGAIPLAAVGSSCTLMVLLTSVILGLCMGSGVVFAQFFGAKQNDNLKTSIYNAFIFIFTIAIVINLLSFFLIDYFIVWLNIPSEAVIYTKQYLKIIFLGILFTFIYNFIASILRSIGNTILPLIFLVIASVTNISLDLVFIIIFKMGVQGAALATVIAQAVSAISILCYFVSKAKYLCPEREHLKFNKKLLKLVINNSMLTAIQQSIMNFGILIIQGLVNSFGVATSAAFAIVVKIDAFAYMPAQDFGNAFSTFVAQNYGAAKIDRIHKGSKIAFRISAIFCITVSLFVYLFARQLMLLFINSSETEIINIGIRYLRVEGVFYIGIGILFLLYGLYRGIGKPHISIVLTIISLGSRIALSFYLSSIPSIGVLGIWWSIPIGWLLADLFGICYYKKTCTELDNRRLLIP